MPSDYSGSYTSDDWDAVMSVLDDGVPHLTLGGETKSKWPSGGGSASVCRARRTTNLSAANGGVSIPMESAVVESGDVSFDSSTGRITVQTGGLWLVSTSLEYDLGGRDVRVDNYTSNTALVEGNITDAGSDPSAVVAPQAVSLSAGDEIETWFDYGGGTVYGTLPTWLQVQKL